MFYQFVDQDVILTRVAGQMRLSHFIMRRDEMAAKGDETNI